MWVAFFLFAQDMEIACDEKTIRSFSPEEKKDYSFSLLALSAPGQAVFSPAFGQVSPPKAHPSGALFPQTRCLDSDSSDGRHLDPVLVFPL